MIPEKLTFEHSPFGTGEIHVYKLNGPLVLGNMFEFQSVLRADTASSIVDLTDVPYIDSAGLGIIINANWPAGSPDESS